MPAMVGYLNHWATAAPQFGLAIHQNDHQARRRFVEWAQNEIAVVPDFHKRILFSDEAHFWLRTFELSTDLTCIAALHGESLVVLGSNS
ncbi:hypothetical protein TNCV_3831281 [Trichonephila clavipes]|nr:hypothetical protein TNCV_3831281 [Trichonephila clavipes]